MQQLQSFPLIDQTKIGQRAFPQLRGNGFHLLRNQLGKYLRKGFFHVATREHFAAEARLQVLPHDLAPLSTVTRQAVAEGYEARIAQRIHGPLAVP
jgi:hypothetical protein